MGAGVWQQHLVEQDKLDRIRDTSIYQDDGAFMSARMVLDLGTGAGHHLGILAEQWPDKMFLGVDNDSLAIQAAREMYRYPNLSFDIGDANNSDLVKQIGTHDYVVARLLVQHLASVSGFAKLAASLLVPGGTLFVFDVHEPSKRFVPAMPAYSSIFRSFREDQQMRRQNESVFDLPTDLKKYGFRISSESVVVKSTDGDLDPQQLLTVLDTNLTVVRDIYRISGDYQTARDELHEWAASDRPYGSLGDYLLRARKD